MKANSCRLRRLLLLLQNAFQYENIARTRGIGGNNHAAVDATTMRPYEALYVAQVAYFTRLALAVTFYYGGYTCSSIPLYIRKLDGSTDHSSIFQLWQHDFFCSTLTSPARSGSEIRVNNVTSMTSSFSIAVSILVEILQKGQPCRNIAGRTQRQQRLVFLSLVRTFFSPRTSFAVRTKSWLSFICRRVRHKQI